MAKPSIPLLRAAFELREDGVLVWARRPDDHFASPAAARRVNSLRAGRPAGCVGKDGYVLVRLGGALLPAHCVVWALVSGAWPAGEIDHADGDRANNRPANLRLAERWQNMANSRRRRSNRTGYKGVSPHQGRFRARLLSRGEALDLGCFDTAEAAHAAYVAAARERAGAFARGA